MNRRILALDGLLYNANGEIVGCPEADAIAHRNRIWCAENVVKEYLGKIIVVDDSNLIVETITDSAAIGHIKLTIRRVRAERQSARPE